MFSMLSYFCLFVLSIQYYIVGFYDLRERYNEEEQEDIWVPLCGLGTLTLFKH